MVYTVYDIQQQLAVSYSLFITKLAEMCVTHNLQARKITNAHGWINCFAGGYNVNRSANLVMNKEKSDVFINHQQKVMVGDIL